MLIFLFRCMWSQYETDLPQENELPFQEPPFMKKVAVVQDKFKILLEQLLRRKKSDQKKEDGFNFVEKDFKLMNISQFYAIFDRVNCIIEERESFLEQQKSMKPSSVEPEIDTWVQAGEINKKLEDFRFSVEEFIQSLKQSDDQFPEDESMQNQIKDYSPVSNQHLNLLKDYRTQQMKKVTQYFEIISESLKELIINKRFYVTRNFEIYFEMMGLTFECFILIDSTFGMLHQKVVEIDKKLFDEQSFDQIKASFKEIEKRLHNQDQLEERLRDESKFVIGTDYHINHGKCKLRDEPVRESQKNDDSKVSQKLDFTPSSNQKKLYGQNKVTTTKTSLYTFIPMNLFQQFRKMTNVYFLFLTILQIIVDGTWDIFSTLFFSLAQQMAKDAYEEIKKYLQDLRENQTQVKVWDPKQKKLIEKYWQDLIPGNFVKLTAGESVPADMIVVGSDDQRDGTVKYTTKSLDGETRVKEMKVHQKITSSYVFSNIFQNLGMISGEFIAERSHNDLYKFSADLILEAQLDDEVMVINNERNIFIQDLDKGSLLLRGSVVNSSEYVYGIVVYTGNQLKIQKNTLSKRTDIKYSRLQSKFNGPFSICIIVIQMLICVIGATIGYYYYDDLVNQKDIYLHGQKNVNSTRSLFDISFADLFDVTAKPETVSDRFLLYLSYFGTWILQMRNLVPIQLWITLEGVNLLKGVILSYDLQMFDFENENDFSYASVACSNLVDELGQVHQIFADKSGTLTQNKMKLKAFTVGKKAYGQEQVDTFSADERYLNDITLKDACYKRQPKLKNFFEIMALCHSISVQESSDGKIIYESFSPDELALVEAASKFGIEFQGKNYQQKVKILDTFSDKKSLKQYKLVDSIGFSSDRRMSTFIYQKNPDSPEYHVYTKGADQQMMEVMRDGDNSVKKFTNKQNQIYSESGLRTLYYGTKTITKQKYIEWQGKSRDAKTEQDKKLANKIIESDLKLVGMTAIRDNLQTDVKETIEFIKKAGIKVWVLTGDKFETAISISKQAGVLDENSQYAELRFESSTNPQQESDQAKEINEESQESNEINENFKTQQADISNQENDNDAQKQNELNSDDKNTIQPKSAGKTSKNCLNVLDHSERYQTQTLEDDQQLEQKAFITNDKLFPKTTISKINESDIEQIDDERSPADQFKTQELEKQQDAIERCIKRVEQFYEKRQDMHSKISLVIEGDYISTIESSEEIRDNFCKIIDKLDCLIACRVTPKQKADLVRIYKSFNPDKSNLAIGDGLNDVPMIQEANIGVGIKGNEGLQAANSADFAIGQFCFLKRLLFIHGRESYRRNSMLMIYMIYKNALNSFAGHFWPGLINAWSGQTIYETMFFEYFNLFTSLHVVWYCLSDFVYDKDSEQKQLDLKHKMNIPIDHNVKVGTILSEYENFVDDELHQEQIRLEKINGIWEKCKKKSEDTVDENQAKAFILDYLNMYFTQAANKFTVKEMDYVYEQFDEQGPKNQISLDQLLRYIHDDMGTQANQEPSYNLSKNSESFRQNEPVTQISDKNWMQYYFSCFSEEPREASKLSSEDENLSKIIQVRRRNELRDEFHVQKIGQQLNPLEKKLEQLPDFYKIGLNDLCFNEYQFGKSFFQGLIVDSLLVFSCTYLPIAYSSLSIGDEYGMMTAGTTVFCASCFLADLWIVFKYHQHEYISTLCILITFLIPHFVYSLMFSKDIIPWLVDLTGKYESPVFGELGKQSQPLVILTYTLVLLAFISKDMFFSLINELYDEFDESNEIHGVKNQLYSSQSTATKNYKDYVTQKKNFKRTQESVQTVQDEFNQCFLDGCTGLLKEVLIQENNLEMDEGENLGHKELAQNLANHMEMETGSVLRCEICDKVVLQSEVKFNKYVAGKLFEFQIQLEGQPENYQLVQLQDDRFVIIKKSERYDWSFRPGKTVGIVKPGAILNDYKQRAQRNLVCDQNMLTVNKVGEKQDQHRYQNLELTEGIVDNSIEIYHEEFGKFTIDYVGETSEEDKDLSKKSFILNLYHIIKQMTKAEPVEVGEPLALDPQKFLIGRQLTFSNYGEQRESQNPTDGISQSSSEDITEQDQSIKSEKIPPLDLEASSAKDKNSSRNQAQQLCPTAESLDTGARERNYAMKLAALSSPFYRNNLQALYDRGFYNFDANLEKLKDHDLDLDATIKSLELDRIAKNYSELQRASVFTNNVRENELEVIQSQGTDNIAELIQEEKIGEKSDVNIPEQTFEENDDQVDQYKNWIAIDKDHILSSGEILLAIRQLFEDINQMTVSDELLKFDFTQVLLLMTQLAEQLEIMKDDSQMVKHDGTAKLFQKLILELFTDHLSKWQVNKNEFNYLNDKLNERLGDEQEEEEENEVFKRLKQQRYDGKLGYYEYEELVEEIYEKWPLLKKAMKIKVLKNRWYPEVQDYINLFPDSLITIRNQILRTIRVIAGANEEIEIIINQDFKVHLQLFKLHFMSLKLLHKDEYFGKQDMKQLEGYRLEYVKLEKSLKSQNRSNLLHQECRDVDLMGKPVRILDLFKYGFDFLNLYMKNYETMIRRLYSEFKLETKVIIQFFKLTKYDDWLHQFMQEMDQPPIFIDWKVVSATDDQSNNYIIAFNTSQSYTCIIQDCSLLMQRFPDYILQRFDEDNFRAGETLLIDNVGLKINNTYN